MFSGSLYIAIYHLEEKIAQLLVQQRTNGQLGKCSDTREIIVIKPRH